MTSAFRWIAVMVVGTLSGAFFFGLAFSLFRAAVFVAERFLRLSGSQ
jgi:hypothetical protein